MTFSPTQFTIERVSQGDIEALLALMRAYRDFYAIAPNDRDLRSVAVALLAGDGRRGGQAVGFATLLFTWSTTSAARAAVMNDLYVAPAARGLGIAQALIARCASESVHHRAVKLTWITRPDNHRALTLYDQIATRDHWITYRIDLREPAPHSRS